MNITNKGKLSMKTKTECKGKVKQRVRLGLGPMLRHQLIMAEGKTLGEKIRNQYKDFKTDYPMELGEKKVTFEEFLKV